MGNSTTPSFYFSLSRNRMIQGDIYQNKSAASLTNNFLNKPYLLVYGMEWNGMVWSWTNSDKC